jgi:hypothetical protein
MTAVAPSEPRAAVPLAGRATRGVVVGQVRVGGGGPVVVP